MLYLNTKFNGVTETIDELNINDFSFYREYTTELKRLRNEYAIAGYGSPYWSSRSTKEWRDR